MMFTISASQDIPGGDYGDVLQNGLLLDVPSENGVPYGRTGPYVPSMMFPGIATTIVVDRVKRALDISGLSGFSFRPVQLVKAVPLDWREWTNQNWKYPSDVVASEDNEPEDYIECGVHSPDLAKKIGPLWELVFQVPSGKICTNFFRSPNSLEECVDDFGQAWLEANCPGEVSFQAYAPPLPKS